MDAVVDVDLNAEHRVHELRRKYDTNGLSSAETAELARLLVARDHGTRSP